MIKINRIVLAVIGMLMITFGIAFIIVMDSKFGVGSFEALCTAVRIFVNKTFTWLNVSIGEVITALSILTILIAYLIKRKFKVIPVVSIVLAFAFGILTDFWIGTVGIGKISELDLHNVVWVLIMLVNITIVTIGACFMIIANLGLTPLDFLVDTIAKKMKVSFGTAKIIFEAIIIGLGVGASYLVGVTSHIGLITFLLGIVIGVEIKFMLPWVKNFFTKRKII